MRMVTGLCLDVPGESPGVKVPDGAGRGCAA